MSEWVRTHVARGLQYECHQQARAREDAETPREREVGQCYAEIVELLQMWLEAPGEHIVEIRGGAWVLQHPLACRLGEKSLFDCPVNRAFEETVATGPEFPRGDGRYFAELDSAGFLLGEKVS